jgi:hypothetical protein
LNGGDYWFTQKYSESGCGYYDYGIYYYYSTNQALSRKVIYRSGTSGNTSVSYYTVSSGFRPVFKLNVESFEIESGTGTKDDPYNLKPGKKFIFAKEVLKINPDAETSAEKSPYVNYIDAYGRTILCRVLYNSDTKYYSPRYGPDTTVDTIKIVTEDVGKDQNGQIKYFGIGYNDPTYDPNNYSWKTSTTNTSKISTSRMMTNSRMDSFAKTLINYNNMTMKDATYLGYNELDCTYLKNLELFCNNPFWLYNFHSKELPKQDNTSNRYYLYYAEVWNGNSIEEVKFYTLLNYSSQYEAHLDYKEYPCKVIFTLNDSEDIIIQSGDGTRENPYNLR